MPETVTADIEYDPNIPETWAVRGDVDGWNDGTRVYIQTPPAEVPDTDEQFIDAETENLCVETFSLGEVNVYSEGVNPSSMTQDIRREYEGEIVDTVPLWWITELLMDEGYIEFESSLCEDSDSESAKQTHESGELDDEMEQEVEELIKDMETHSAPESTPDGAELRSALSSSEKTDSDAAELVAESVSTDGIVDTPEVKEIAEAAYMEAVNDYTSMGTMTSLEVRTAEDKFEQFWQRNYGDE